MKKLLVLFTVFLAFLAISCKKEQASNQLAPVEEKMEVWKVKAKYGIDLIKEQENYYSAFPSARRGGKKLAAETVVTVWFNDLEITEPSAGVISSTVSSDAYIAGVQDFVDSTTVDGAVAVWECQRYYSTPPGSGISTSCNTIGAGFYRGFSADFTTYDIHISPFKVVL